MFLEVSNIQKCFQQTEVLKGIDFSMEQGQVLSIIGSSGSGKTTLLRCLNFLETPDRGTIRLKETEIFDAERNASMTDAELRANRLHFGLVFQQFNLFPQYTALENVVLAPDLLIKEQFPKEDRAIQKEKIKETGVSLLNRVGLGDKLDSYPYQLSGGQQQRVAIARALALQPDILCFDEPTSALDPELTGEVLQVIRSLKSRDTTMIIVTHEMEFAAQLSDYVIFMADGIIEEEGLPEEVIRNPKSPKTRAFLQLG